MQREYIYPAIGNRLSPKEWAEVGKPEILKVAIDKKRDILSTHFPRHIPEAVDDAIRAKHPIKLPRESMRPAKTRY